jgi:Mrp family chromosome partitioning ATPase
MSRILKALRRIEVQRQEDAPVRPDAMPGKVRRSRAARRRQRAEDRGQTAEDRGQTAEARNTASSAYRPVPTAYCPPPTDDVESDPQFSQLADHLLRRFPPDRHAVLMLTSPGREDNKTSLTAGLAEALAARIPGEVLAVDGATQTPDFDDLREQYRFVVIDGPCLAQHETTTMMAACCDGVFLVITLGHTGRREARHAVGILERGGANVLGCVVAGG